MHKFDSFDESRRRKIINIGFKEFGTHGRKRASLNKILVESDIPKGVFYHYFKNKQELYIYLIQSGINVITTKLMDSTILDEPDFIKRLIKSYMIKVDAYKEYSHFETFLMKVYQEDSTEFLEYLQIKESQDFGQRVIHERIDFNRFKTNDDDANTRVVARYLQQVFNDIITRIQGMENAAIKEYLDQEAQHLKKILYKEEYHD